MSFCPGILIWNNPVPETEPLSCKIPLQWEDHTVRRQQASCAGLALRRTPGALPVQEEVGFAQRTKTGSPKWGAGFCLGMDAVFHKRGTGHFALRIKSGNRPGAISVLCGLMGPRYIGAGVYCERAAGDGQGATVDITDPLNSSAGDGHIASNMNRIVFAARRLVCTAGLNRLWVQYDIMHFI